jgi:nucleoside-diphosphate-sugar epimerase/FAD/FMN-containing dehydrogenase
LLERYKVRALFRGESEESRRWAGTGCDVVFGDLGHSGALRELTRGASVTVHCAARILGLSRREFLETNVNGTRNLVEEVIRARCRRFVHLSSIAVYSAARPVPDAYMEDLTLTPFANMDSYSYSKLLAEQVVRELTLGSCTEAVILRPTCIYGPHMGSWMNIPLKQIARGRPLLLGANDGTGYMDAVHVDDVVSAVLAAAETPGVGGETFNVGHEKIAFATFYSFLGDIAGKPLRYGSLRNLERVRKIVSAGSRLSALREIRDGIDMVRQMSGNTRCYPSDKARARLGYSPQVTLSIGMLRSEFWLKERGQVAKQNHTLFNADRHYSLRPAALVRPGSLEEISDALREASRHGLGIKAIGALHSFVPVPATDGLCMAMDRCRGLLSINDLTVTVQAGMTIASLNELLARHNMALPAHGSHVAQTVGGAISTATHGGSLHQGTMSDYVEAIELVKVSGEVMSLKRGDALFPAAVVSMGLLGVLHAVTLRCVPRQYLDAQAVLKPMEEVLESFDAIQRENDFVDLFYHPRVGMAEMLLIRRMAPEIAPEARKAGSRPNRARRRLVSLVLKSLLTAMAATRSEALHRSISRQRAGATHKSRRGWSDSILAFTDLDGGEPFPIDDLEFGIPYSRATEALRTLSDYFPRTGRCPCFFPVHIRCSREGDAWLGPNYQRDTCWIEFWSYPPDPALYRDLHALFASFEYRPHWGKLTPADGAHLGRVFPRWAEFSRLRETWDPEDRLLNDWARNYFG